MTPTPSGFPIHTATSAPAGSQPVAAAVQKAFGGMLPNLFGVLAGSPAAIGAAATLSQLMEGTSLQPVEQHLIALAMSRENACDYCLAAHTFLARNVPQPALTAAREGRRIDDAKLEALRQFTLELVGRKGHVSDATRGRFREAGYSDTQALEVITMVTLKTLHNLVNNLAKTPIDAPFTAHLQATAAQGTQAAAR
jgi:alkylhydroperoxidase family enzyme